MIDFEAVPGWYDLGGLLLTVVGFTVAFIQLWKTRNAAQAAADELDRARKKLSADQLSAVVIQLQTIVGDLDFAIENNDREIAHRALLRFSFVANESVSLLSNLPTDHGVLQGRLSTTATFALDTKASIVGRRTVDVARTAKPVSKDIGALAVEIAGLVAQDRYQIGGDKSV